jgi:hypothetical protein
VNAGQRLAVEVVTASVAGDVAQVGCGCAEIVSATPDVQNEAIEALARYVADALELAADLRSGFLMIGNLDGLPIWQHVVHRMHLLAD